MTDLSAAVTGIAGRARRTDKAWLAVALIFGGLAAVAPGQAVDSVGFVAGNLLSIAPFLLFAIAVAAYAKASGADGLIAEVFRGRLAPMIVLAAVFGGLSPFCSCGVIPLIAALLAMGVPLPAVMAFWLASPIMDPSMFIITTGALGTDFAVAKTLAAVAIGLFGGFATVGLQRLGAFADPLREGVGGGGCGGNAVTRPAERRWRFWQDPARRADFAAEALRSTLFLTKWLTLAFLLESLMLAYLPAETISGVLDQGGFWAIPTAALIGVPAYLNGYAALPLVAGLMDFGLTPGAAMAFLVAGGVTSLPAAIAVFALVKRPVFVAYIGFALTGAMLCGLAFQTYLAA